VLGELPASSRAALSRLVDLPHGRHLHGLHPYGRETLDELFPGFTGTLIAAGAVRGDVLGNVRWQLSGHQLWQANIGLPGLLASRPFLEGPLRAMVQRTARPRCAWSTPTCHDCTPPPPATRRSQPRWSGSSDRPEGLLRPYRVLRVLRGNLVNGGRPIALGVIAAAGDRDRVLSALGPSRLDVAAWLVVVTSALVAAKDTVNWLTGVRDEFSESNWAARSAEGGYCSARVHPAAGVHVPGWHSRRWGRAGRVRWHARGQRVRRREQSSIPRCRTVANGAPVP
jgi:hypothetical protein